MKNSVWELRHVSKSFNNVPVLSEVDITLSPGETHSLLGCNGAGKSTLVRILSGHLQPDSGSICLDGKEISFLSPGDASAAGVETSTQELMLFPNMSIADNLFIHSDPYFSKKYINYRHVNTKAQQIIDRLHINADPNRKICELSHSEKYLIQFARCWIRHPRLLILDELSASLSSDECETVFEIISELKAEGTAVLYITQRMNDIMRISDSMTLLRDGKVVAMPEMHASTWSELCSFIFGEAANKPYPKLPIPHGEEMLQVRGVSNTYVRNVSFSLHRGEIIGIIGNAGSGRTRLLRAIAGIDSVAEGSVNYYRQDRYKAGYIARDIAYLPEDRDSMSLFYNMNCGKNITISSLDKVTVHGRINLSSENLFSRNAIDRLGIQPLNYDNDIHFLSGGNKQKLVIARFLSSNCSIYLFDEPTQGVDTAGKVEIYNIINELARKGAGIMIASSDFSELIGMCDSLIVMNSGTMVCQCLPVEYKKETQELNKSY